jgi:hypothetical protein
VIDIAIYDENGSESIIENVKIQASEIITGEVIGLTKKPAAILINANNKGYCRAILDKESEIFFR